VAGGEWFEIKDWRYTASLVAFIKVTKKFCRLDLVYFKKVFRKMAKKIIFLLQLKYAS